MNEAYKAGLEDGKMIAIHHAIKLIMRSAQAIAQENREPRQSDIIHLANMIESMLENNQLT